MVSVGVCVLETFYLVKSLPALSETQDLKLMD